MKKFLLTFLLALSQVSHGAPQTSTGQLNTLHTYSTFGDGDVVFTMHNLPPTCSGGFWLRKTDLGFDGYLSFLLSAFHANATVSVVAFDNEIWNGSGAPFCRVDAIALSK